MVLHSTKIKADIKKAKKVFKYESLPMRSPTVGTIAWALLLYTLGWPDWIWGVFVTVAVIFWAVWFHRLASDIFVDAFPKDRDESHHWPDTNKRIGKYKVQ